LKCVVKISIVDLVLLCVFPIILFLWCFTFIHFIKLLLYDVCAQCQRLKLLVNWRRQGVLCGRSVSHPLMLHSIISIEQRNVRVNLCSYALVGFDNDNGLDDVSESTFSKESTLFQSQL